MVSQTPEKFSTLEVPFAEAHGQPLPEVNRSATAAYDYPEAVKQEPVLAYYGYEHSNGLQVDGPTAAATAKSRRVCGLRLSLFIGLIVATVLIAIGAGVGIAVGLTRSSTNDASSELRNETSASATSSASSASATSSISNVKTSKALLQKTKLGAANFTDEFGNDNYLIIYQRQDRSIYMSAFNSSEDTWIVSPVVDGTNGIGLDLVRNGTGLGLDVYYQNETNRYLHLYFQSPTGVLKNLFRTWISTSTISSPKDWESPFDYDIFTGMNGSALRPYARQCYQCMKSEYIFFQSESGGINAGALPGTNADGWEGRYFDGSPTASNNTSIGLASVAAVNGTRSIATYYRSESGVLMQLTYKVDQVYDYTILPRTIGENTAITAFATGFNESDSSNNPNPLNIQVLTADPDSADGVLLTYLENGGWKAKGEVKDLSDCTSRASMASTHDHKVFCVVDSEEGVAIKQWAWRGNPAGSSSTFTSYESVGNVNTTIAD